MFGDDEKPCCVPVQTIYTAEDESLLLFLIVPDDAVGQRICVIALRRVNGGIGRLVGDEKIVILIDNRKKEQARRVWSCCLFL